ncbi:MAG: glucose-6-phosphate isomerase family protein [Methanotrichaceae archaeon]
MMELEFGGRSKDPDIRWLNDLKEVLYDKGWLAKTENIELYYMYRDLYLSNADKDKLIDQDLRYDITVIPPRMLGVEYVKTAGHYHPIPPGGTVSYPELYEVLEGEAIYLLQKQNMSDVVAVYASAGDKVLVPPNYGHITINRSNKILKMANLVARNFSSIYDSIKEHGGGAYFYTTQGYIKNERCPEAAELRRIEAPDINQLKKLGISKGKEIYPLIKEPGMLDYLVNPGEHLELFEGLI